MAERLIRILVVDDELFVRDSLVEFLDDQKDFQVCAAASGEEMLAILNEGDQDVAIVDMSLPGLSGDLLIQQAHQRLPSMRFLIHTGSIDFSLSAELVEMGIRPEHVILKPKKNLDIIVESIRSLV